MPQVIKLAVGTTPADSDVIPVTGNSVTVGIYAEVGTELDPQALAYLYQGTPGAPNLITVLDSASPSTLVDGLNSVFVRRVFADTPFGVFSE